MGLDMYLERKIYLGGKWDKDIKVMVFKGGFFFGGLDYDEYYFDCVADTISIITEVLKENTKSNNSSIYYSSSW